LTLNDESKNDENDEDLNSTFCPSIFTYMTSATTLQFQAKLCDFGSCIRYSSLIEEESEVKSVERGSFGTLGYQGIEILVFHF